MIIKKALQVALATSLILAPNLLLASSPSVSEIALSGQQTAPNQGNTHVRIKPTGNIDVTANAYVLIDFNSGQIIASKNLDERMPPASLTKMMTLYIVSSALKSGQIKLEDNVRISEKAWKTGGSRMFVQVKSKVPVEKLLQGIIVASGNDACVALAEHVAGSETAFAAIMNQTAAQLGMTNSHFTDSTGLPNENHYSTPRDIATLAYALVRDFPEYYHWYKQKWFSYNDIKQPNRNRLLWRDDSVDGIKTGHTDSAGYCLASSAIRNNVRLVAVVMGSTDDKNRATDSQTVLNYGYRNFESHKLFAANQTLSSPRIWGGSDKTVPMGLTKDLYVSIPVGQYADLKANLKVNSDLSAPIHQGQNYGTVDITLEGQVIASKPLIALQSIQSGGLWSRTRDKIVKLFHNWFS